MDKSFIARETARLLLEVEAINAEDAAPGSPLAQAIEAHVRSQLQVRIAVTVLAPGQLPKGAYKNSLLAVRGQA